VRDCRGREGGEKVGKGDSHRSFYDDALRKETPRPGARNVAKASWGWITGIVTGEDKKEEKLKRR